MLRCFQQYTPLTREEILDVLRQTQVCRLAVAQDDQPYVVPMRYRWRYDEQGRLWFWLCSPPCGRKLRWMQANSRVALEFEEQEGTAVTHTVLVRGRVVRFRQRSPRAPYRVEIYAASATGRAFQMSAAADPAAAGKENAGEEDDPK